MVGRLIAAMVDIARIDDAAADDAAPGEYPFDWLDRLEELIGDCPDKAPQNQSLRRPISQRDRAFDEGGDQPRPTPGEGF